MRPKFAAFSRYRPRVLTVVVLVVVAALIVLANLSFDYQWGRDFGHKSYGWPLHWHRYVDSNSDPIATVGWYLSLPRLTGNVAIWLAMTAVPAGLCEWLLRRYRPRLRWRLRTMLVAVGMMAATCAWFAAARNRANLQDPIIAEMSYPTAGTGVLVERWGPKWLDLLGADRFRRTIVAALLKSPADHADNEKRLKQLARLPSLRTLKIEIRHLSPEIAQALAELRQLNRLSIEQRGQITDGDRAWEDFVAILGKMTHLEYLHLSEETIRGKRLERLAALKRLKSLHVSGTLDHNDEPISHECLEAVGKITQLECLELEYMKLRPESLTCLAGLSNLKLLRLTNISCGEPTLFAGLPPLPRLKTVEVSDSVFLDDPRKNSAVRNEDLRHLAVLPSLKSLGLYSTWVTADGLKELASLESLEELAIDDYHTSPAESCASAAGVESLLVLKHLRNVHLFRSTTFGKARYIHASMGKGEEVQVLAEDLERFQRALESFRRAKPGIVIDAPDFVAIAAEWRDETSGPFLYDDDRFPIRPSAWQPESYGRWMTPAERAKFEREEGWANFYGAGRRANDGHVIAVEF